MNNSSKNKFPKNNKDNNKNSLFNDYSKSTNRSEKNQRFLKNSSKNKIVDNLNKNDKNDTFSSLKKRKPIFKSNTEFSNKNPDNHQDLLIRKILMIGYGVNIRFMRLLVVKERLIGFGVLRKFFLQINFIFCLRTLNQKESSLKKFLGTGFLN